MCSVAWPSAVLGCLPKWLPEVRDVRFARDSVTLPAPLCPLPASRRQKRAVTSETSRAIREGHRPSLPDPRFPRPRQKRAAPTLARIWIFYTTGNGPAGRVP